MPRSKVREIVKTYVNGGNGEVSMVVNAEDPNVIIKPENNTVTILLPTKEARRISRNLLVCAQRAESIQKENNK